MSDAHRLSVVPSLDSPPPTPLRMGLSLMGSSWAVGLLLGVVTMAVGPLVLSLPGLTIQGVVRLAAAQAAAAWSALFVGTLVSVHRMRPLYASLREGSRARRRVNPPPPAAVRVAFHAPERVVWSVTLTAQLTVLTDALGWLPISGLSGWPRVALPLLAIAIACAGVHPSIMLWRSIIWGWLGRLHPDDVPAFERGELGKRLAFTAALPVAMVGLSALVVLLSHLFAFQASQAGPLALLPSPWWTDSLTPFAAGGVIVATTLATWMLARRLGDRSAADLSRLSAEIERVQARGRPSTRAQLAVFELIPRTAAGVELGRVLADLAGRISEIAEKEQAAGRAMDGVRRLRTQFLATMSHDLRSPLNAIVGFADLVASGAEGPVTLEQRESVQMIQRSARDLLQLVNHILDWAQLEAGRLEVMPVPLAANALMDAIVAAAVAAIAERPLLLRTDIPPDLPKVTVDQPRVARAVLSLIEHAMGSIERGEVLVSARVGLHPAGERSELRLEISDDGPGIRRADWEHVFEAFREIQDPSGKRVRGLGVGLAVAREVIRAHGGDISLSEQGPGSTFVVVLPMEGMGQGGPVKVQTLPPPG